MNDNTLDVNFVANAGVKDIVGRGLIYNDNVAIIELVKNAKDADSSKAIIELTDVNIDLEGDILSEFFSPKIIIKDFGVGMTKEDIQNKWLNIAYSEKKNIKNKEYAGNKGVGRFSCDRLGKELTLYTKSRNGDFIQLYIDWTLYENKGRNDEISTIPLTIRIMEENEFLKDVGEERFTSGTVLKISKLRSVWDEKKLRKLLSELEKFSPSLDNGFEIHMKSNMCFDTKDNLDDKLNSKIDNGILDKLKIKTIYIESSIDKNGEFIKTTLYYQGEELYSYKVENPYQSLSNISIEAHYLDTISKGYFTRRVGVNPNNYGSMFLFYNGFRVSPYGNEKNDWLNLDQRKTQGVSRNLGTRDIFGKITIRDQNDSFSVITSREGLVHNQAYYELAASDEEEKVTLINKNKEYGYILVILRQLEAFVVDGLEWNRLVDTLNQKNSVSARDAEKDPDRYILKELSTEKVKKSIDRMVSSNFNIVDYKLNSDLILKLKEINELKYNEYLDEFVESLGDDDFASLSKNKKAQTKKVIQELKEKKDIAIEQKLEAEKVADVAIKDKIIVAERLKTEEKRSIFLERLVDPEKTLDALITHVIQQISGGIEKDARSILSAYYDSPEFVSKEELIEVIEHAVLDISTIKETANMATKADFNIKVSSVKQDIIFFLESYIDKVVSRSGKWGVKISFENKNSHERIINFKPAEACVLFVNLLENSRRAGTKNLKVLCDDTSIKFIDDGKGFDFERLSKDDYFKKGITTTTGGSGLGLYHCKNIAKSLGAELTINNNDNKPGAVVALEF
ncbi:ATP-binding protein [Vibrio aestuarianus subsp. cardii]|uniref:ATP-binding protein n=1 Tax=Vibrio aestuarianus TaxID=28171 RepID=UPI001558EDEB|nr:ATP-binding protein [Vibrio aestuarianus]NGZ67687.1 ATP-binding protein [Vibrio aestuarianus subsp. cardii]